MTDKFNGWRQVVWPGTTAPETLKLFTSYCINRGSGKLWLLVYDEPCFLDCKYHLISSYGTNSDKSYSGLLPARYNGLTLEEAQAAVIIEHNKKVGTKGS